MSNFELTKQTYHWCVVRDSSGGCQINQFKHVARAGILPRTVHNFGQPGSMVMVGAGVPVSTVCSKSTAVKKLFALHNIAMVMALLSCQQSAAGCGCGCGCGPARGGPQHYPSLFHVGRQH